MGTIWVWAWRKCSGAVGVRQGLPRLGCISQFERFDKKGWSVAVRQPMTMLREERFRDGIAMPDAAPNKNPAQLAAVPCELRCLERAAGGMRFRGAEIACDVRSSGALRLRERVANSEELSQDEPREHKQSLAKRYCGDWRHAA